MKVIIKHIKTINKIYVNNNDDKPLVYWQLSIYMLVFNRYKETLKFTNTLWHGAPVYNGHLRGPVTLTLFLYDNYHIGRLVVLSNEMNRFPKQTEYQTNRWPIVRKECSTRTSPRHCTSISKSRSSALYQCI